MSIILPVQAYLRSGKTLADLRQRYDIESHFSADRTLAVLNYRLLSPMTVPIVASTRGLVLEVGTWNVACKSIDAFFEPENPAIGDTLKDFDWESALAYSKYDGTLLCIYNWNDEWNVSTRYSARGEENVVTSNIITVPMTWKGLVIKTLEDMGHTWEEFTAKLNPKIFYVFELCATEIQVVVVYPDRQLWLVAMIDADTCQEISLNDVADFPGLVASGIAVSSLDDVNALIEQNSEPYKCEGFVVVDKDFRRLKIRNPKYARVVSSASVDDEVSALKNIVHLMNTGQSGTITIIHSDSAFGGFSVDGVKGVAAHSLMNRLLVMSDYVTQSWDQVKSLPPEEREKNPIYNIWPSSAKSLEAGHNFADVLGRHTEEETLGALRRFEAHLNDQSR